MKKRLIATLLVLSVMLTLFPVGFAAEEIRQ